MTTNAPLMQQTIASDEIQGRIWEIRVRVRVRVHSWEEAGVTSIVTLQLEGRS